MSEMNDAPAQRGEGATQDEWSLVPDSIPAGDVDVSDGAQSSPLDAHDTGRGNGFPHRPLPTPPVPGWVVMVTTPRGNYTRRVFLSLRSAENAVERARDRGQYAAITLCRLVPEAGAL